MHGTPAMPSVVAFICVLVLAGCSRIGPADTVKRFYRSIEAGEVKTAISLVSGSAVSMMGSKKIEAALQSETAKIARKKGIESIAILSEEIDGQGAEVHVRVTYGNSETDEETLHLTRIDGRWLLTPKGK